jgi:Na+-transporting NADH:ubiquinone oxidoreductase subunit NqrC
MRPGFLSLLACVGLLTGCAGSGWPGQYGEDPTVYDFPIVEKRWTAASLAPLGSKQDLAGISLAVQRAHPDVAVQQVRWISATEVMVLAVRGQGLALGTESFYGALEKDGDQWRLIAWYDGSAS